MTEYMFSMYFLVVFLKVNKKLSNIIRGCDFAAAWIISPAQTSYQPRRML